MDYPFDALEAGECLAPASLKDSGLTIGQKFTVELEMGNLLRAMATDYNTKTDPSDKFKAATVPTRALVFFECTIKGFLEEAYGKYGKDDSDT